MLIVRCDKNYRIAVLLMASDHKRDIVNDVRIDKRRKCFEIFLMLTQLLIDSDIQNQNVQ